MWEDGPIESRDQKNRAINSRRDKIESVKRLVKPGERHALLEDLSAYLYSF